MHIRRGLIRGQLDLGSPFSNNERIDGRFFDLAMKLQLESILQQRLQHQAQLAIVRIWVFCLSFNIEAVRANPSRAAGYLKFLDNVCGADQVLQRGASIERATVAYSTASATICSRLDRRDREFGPRRSGGLITAT